MSFVSLKDKGTREWRTDRLAAGAKRIIGSCAIPTAADWFCATNELALALKNNGEAAAASELMLFSIEVSSRLSQIEPNAVQYGLQAWINQAELLAIRGEGDPEGLLLACYRLPKGLPVGSNALLGLRTESLSDADPAIARRSLSVVRNRSQSALLKFYLSQNDCKVAADFARMVFDDYPRCVDAGMLDSAEVLAFLAPRDPRIRHLNGDCLESEAQCVVFLQLLRWHPEMTKVALRSFETFDHFLVKSRSLFSLQNPLSPVLWRVAHASITADVQLLDGVVQTALAAAISRGDQALYARIAALLTPPGTVPTDRVPLVTAAFKQRTRRDNLEELSHALCKIAETRMLRTSEDPRSNHKGTRDD